MYYLLIVLFGCLNLTSGLLPRIVGGNITTIEKHPWQVSIQIFGLHSCGGSIIGPDTILTAAHCIDEILVNLYQVVVGTADLTQVALKVEVSESIAHDDYDSDTYDYDIAVLKLKQSLILSDKIKSIKLPDASYEVPEGSPLMTSGWGVTEPGGSVMTDVLRDVVVYAVDRETCSRKLSSVGVFTERMICAGVSGGGKDTCQGDSGGGVELDGTLIGIVSWGAECGDADHPGVYTHVSYFRSWIRENADI